MSGKEKVKMIFEITIFALVVWAMITIIHPSISGLLHNIVYLIPNKLDDYFIRIMGHPLDTYIYLIFDSILEICELVLAFLLVFYIFKIRYLDNSTSKVKKEEIVSKEESETINEVVVKKIEKTEHKTSFLEGIANIFILFLKIFLGIVGTAIAFLCIGLVAAVIFCLVTGGQLFVYLAISLIGLLVFNVFLVILIYNWLFNQKQPHKLFTAMVVVSLLLSGIGVGFFSTKFTKIEVLDDEGLERISESIVVDEIGENDVIYVESNNVKHVIDENRDDILLEFSYPKNMNLKNDVTSFGDENDIWYYLSGEMDSINFLINDLSKDVIRHSYSGYDYLTCTITCNSKNMEHIANLGY